VFAEGTGAGLGEADGREETQTEENAEQAANHGTPQGNTIGEDYIGYFARRRNPMVAVVDDRRLFGLSLAAGGTGN
jgi:hypothetical protein